MQNSDMDKYLLLNLAITYEYFQYNDFSFNEYQNSASNGLFYETDLNIFVMNIKDIFLAYITRDNYYCEIGYSF